jgi:hypothetical protein
VDYDNDGFLDLFITCGDGGLTTTICSTATTATATAG